MRKSHAQEILNQTVYAKDSDIQEHIKLLRTRKAAVDNLNASPMESETWMGIIIRSIPPTTKWLPVIPSLYTMISTADIFSTLIAHGMILDRATRNKPTSGSSNTALLVAKVSDSCTNPNCKAKKRSTHTTADCYWPGGGKEGQFPPNFGQRARANVISSNQSDVEHFVLFAKALDTEERSGIVLDGDEPGERQDYPMALISKSFESIGKGKIPRLSTQVQATQCLCREMLLAPIRLSLLVLVILRKPLTGVSILSAKALSLNVTSSMVRKRNCLTLEPSIPQL
jgi:hypothetical protein